MSMHSIIIITSSSDNCQIIINSVYSPTAELCIGTVAMVTGISSISISFVSSESVTNCTHTSTRPSPSVTLYWSISKDISRGISENRNAGVDYFNLLFTEIGYVYKL